MRNCLQIKNLHETDIVETCSDLEIHTFKSLILMPQITEGVHECGARRITELKFHLKLDSTQLTFHGFVVEGLKLLLLLLVIACKWLKVMDEWYPAKPRIEANNEIMNDCRLARNSLEIDKDHFEYKMQNSENQRNLYHFSTNSKICGVDKE